MKTYTHNLYLIERTKLLEGYLCQSISFTNILHKQWGTGALNIGSELVNLAIRQNEINVARQQESITQYLNQIRIGANSGRIGKN